MKRCVHHALVALALLFANCCANRIGTRQVSRPGPVQDGWQDLLPGTDLRIENAYYKEGAPRHGLAGFLGTGVAVYREGLNGGLRLISSKTSVLKRPHDQPAVENLLRSSQRRHRRYRFFFAVVFDAKADIHGSVLLGAESAEEIENLSAKLLSDPNSVCGGHGKHCSVFPDTCTVSLQMEVVVNGVPRDVIWGSLLGSVVRGAHRIELARLSKGTLSRIQLDPADPQALHMTLLPGDQVKWE